QALLALGREEEAGRATSRLRARWEAQAPRQGPLGYRALQLSEARLAAERGEFDTVRRLLQQPLPGVPAHQLFGILARAAERGQHVAEAARLYAQAFVLAP